MNAHPQSRPEWYALVKEYKKGHLKRSKFCQQHGLITHRFAYYLRDYNKRQEKPSPTFSPVIVQPPAFPPASEIQLDLPNGIRCHVPCQINPNQLKQLVGALLLC